MASPSIIETGVDKLVGLVKKQKRVSIAEAAKFLNVSTDVIEEWADFLEEEGIISVEYKLTTPYLVERDMDLAEVEKKAKDFVDKKDGFIRNAEVAVAKIELDSEAVKHMKKEFLCLKEGLEQEVKAMKTDLSELEKYEALKGNIDEQITQAKNEYTKKIDELNRKIEGEKKKYSEVIQGIEKGKKDIDTKKIRVNELKDMEDHLLHKLSEFKAMMEKIKSSINEEEEDIEDVEDHLERLEKMSESIEGGIQQKIGAVSGIMAENEKTKQKIIDIQDNIVKKAVKYQEDAKEETKKGKDTAKKFEEFFRKKMQAEEMILSVEKEGQMLERELVYLIKKAKAFDLSPNKKKMGVNVKELKTRFQNVEKKQGKYKEELKKLMSLFK